jgi:parallel beta-helix repeat protein
MSWTETAFWGCVTLVAYTYLVYPLVLFFAARWWGRSVRQAPFEGSISFVLAAHNEAHRIAGRRDELLALLDRAGIAGEVVIVSDGSADATATVAGGSAAERRVRVIEIADNVGKAEALNRGVASSTADVIVFADARQRWAPDALDVLLRNFADPGVGAVTGDLCLESAPGVVAGVGLYWRYEKAIRKLESRLHSTAGATGAISAVRRELFRPIPMRTILDDVYWPMRVVMRHRRVIHEGDAKAFDRLPGRARDEFHRKVRTLSGNFQLVCRLPALLLPWRNPIWAQFVSHKLLRLAVPWLLIAMLCLSAVLGGTLYRAALGVQLAGYLLGIAGMYPRVASKVRIASAAASFLVLNAAAWFAFWIWISGRAGSSWRKVTYASERPAETPLRQALAASPVGSRGASTLLPLFVGFLSLLSTTATTAAEPDADLRSTGRVYYVAENGVDSNSGSPAAPLRTLQRAADRVHPGDVVHVRPGKYTGMNFYRGTGGTREHPIRFEAEAGAMINSSATDGPNADSGINLEPGHGWFVFSGFRIVNEDGSIARACIRVTSNPGTQILNNVCDKGGTWGIFVSTSDDVLIEGNVCRGSPGQHGVYVSRGSKRAVIRRNTLTDNHWDGLHLNGGAEGPIEHCLIENNVIFGNELSGIDADGIRNCRFQNNVVYANGKHAVTLYRHDTSTGCLDNLFVNNTFVSQSMFAVQMHAGSTANTFYNNILFQTRQPSNYGSIGVEGTPRGLVSDHNLVSDSMSTDLGVGRMSLETWRKVTGQDRHSFIAPATQVFVNLSENNYRLRAASPAIGAGVRPPAPNLAPEADIDGNARPPGAAIDIGAWQYVSKQPE